MSDRDLIQYSAFFVVFEQTIRLRLVSGPADNYIIYIVSTHILCKKMNIQKSNSSKFTKQIRWLHLAKMVMQLLGHNGMPR